MIDDHLTAEELDQCNHAEELKVAQFTLSRFLSISPVSTGAGGGSQETQTTLGTQIPQQNMSSAQSHQERVFRGLALEEHTAEESLGHLLHSVCRRCTAALKLGSEAEIYIGNLQGF